MNQNFYFYLKKWKGTKRFKKRGRHDSIWMRKTCTYLLHGIGRNQTGVEVRDQLGSKVIAQAKDDGALD